MAAKLCKKQKLKAKGAVLGAMAYLNAVNCIGPVAADAVLPQQDIQSLPKPQTQMDELATGEKTKSYQMLDNMRKVAQAAVDKVDEIIFGRVEAVNTYSYTTVNAALNIPQADSWSAIIDTVASGGVVSNAGAAHWGWNATLFVKNMLAGGIITNTMAGNNRYILVTNMTNGQIKMQGPGNRVTVTNMLNGVVNMYQGSAWILTMANGTLNLIGGVQNISKNGSIYTYTSAAFGYVNTMKNGIMNINSGTGTITTFSGGQQHVTAGTGWVVTGIGGVQYVSGGYGFIETEMPGSNPWCQYIYAGTGSIGTMMKNHPGQMVSGGTGQINVIKAAGCQGITAAGAVGYISTVEGSIASGRQDVYGTGYIGTINSGANFYQYIYARTGYITSAAGGRQTIAAGATGIISSGLGATQSVLSGGKGTIHTFEKGLQIINAGGSAVIDISMGANAIATNNGILTLLTSAGLAVLNVAGGASICGTGTMTAGAGSVSMAPAAYIQQKQLDVIKDGDLTVKADILGEDGSTTTGVSGDVTVAEGGQIQLSDNGTLKHEIKGYTGKTKVLGTKTLAKKIIHY